MSLVVDASIALAWIFPDENSATADTALERVTADGAHAPSIWKLEIANVLRAAVRRGRCTADFEGVSLRRLDRLAVTIDRDTDAHAWGRTRQIAAHHGLTIYDACYLELAQRRALPLATLDDALAQAARAAKVRVVDRG